MLLERAARLVIFTYIWRFADFSVYGVRYLTCKHYNALFHTDAFDCIHETYTCIGVNTMHIKKPVQAHSYKCTLHTSTTLASFRSIVLFTRHIFVSLFSLISVCLCKSNIFLLWFINDSHCRSECQQLKQTRKKNLNKNLNKHHPL